jgi:chromate transporter
MDSHQRRLLELATTFLHLGATAFGGPAAHIAMMERELVTRRAWLEPQEFLDLIGATNLIPGPNSTELAIHIGERRAGLSGLLVAGISFILPAMLMVLALSWTYVRYQSLPQIGWVLAGVQPIVIAIIAHALWKLGRTALKSIFTLAVALAAGVLVVRGVPEVAVIFGAALIGLLAGWRTPNAPQPTTAISDHNGSTPKAPGTPAMLLGALPLISPSLTKLFLVFLKIGSLIYGSGYVLLAFLREDLVQKLGWVSDRQLLDAIAIGQITPGPLFTSATFLGYLVHGFSGALIATLGIFLPSFCFVALLAQSLKRLRFSPRARPFLDAVNAASLALMAVVTWELGRASIAEGSWVFTLVSASAALLLLTTTKVNSLWLLLAGALAGYWLQS